MPVLRKLPIKVVVSIALGAAVFTYLAISVSRQPSATSQRSDRNLPSLPEDLTALQEATGYSGWDRVQGFSRALNHHRQLRFHKDSNVFISETGTAENHVDVIEVILMRPNSGAKVEFGLYDPGSGKRIIHYPDSTKFDIFGIHGGSGNQAPGVCIACHTEQRPLIALVPWSQALEDDLTRSREMGQGIRSDLMVPLSNDAVTRDQMAVFNKVMQDRFPDQVSDIRNWMAIRTRHQAEQDAASKP